MSISVDARGALIVRSPRAYPLERIFSFIQKKEAWIRKQQEKIKNRAFVSPPEVLDGYSFPLLGKRVEIVLYDGGRVALNGQTLFVPRINSKEKIVQWLKRYAKKSILPIVDKRAMQMGLKVESVSVTGAKTRWGSCSGKGRLHFSYRLIYAPEEIVDYVVVHELAHIPHKNHGSQFWAFTKSVCPDYVKKRKWLKENAFLMDIF